MLFRLDGFPSESLFSASSSELGSVFCAGVRRDADRSIDGLRRRSLTIEASGRHSRGQPRDFKTSPTSPTRSRDRPPKSKLVRSLQGRESADPSSRPVTASRQAASSRLRFLMLQTMSLGNKTGGGAVPFCRRLADERGLDCSERLVLAGCDASPRIVSIAAEGALAATTSGTTGAGLTWSAGRGPTGGRKAGRSFRSWRDPRPVSNPIRDLTSLRRLTKAFIRRSRFSQCQNELSYRFGHEWAHRVRQLLLFVDQASTVSVRGTGKSEPVREGLQSRGFPSDSPRC